MSSSISHQMFVKFSVQWKDISVNRIQKKEEEVSKQLKIKETGSLKKSFKQI